MTTTLRPTDLSAKHREQYFQEGWLVIDPQIPERVLDRVIADLEGKYPDGLNGDGVQPPTRIQDAWKTSRAVHQVAAAPHVLEVLKFLYGRKPLPFQTLNFPVGTIQPAHSDCVHFNSTPAGFMCGVWVALENIDENNGPVEYYPGSHKLPEFDMSDVGVEPKDELYAEYEKFMRRVVQHYGLKPKLATIKKGQAFIWSSNLIHGGSQRRDLMRTRHSQVTHFYFEGCKYWTPLRSRGLDTFWRTPEWIPAL